MHLRPDDSRLKTIVQIASTVIFDSYSRGFFLSNSVGSMEIFEGALMGDYCVRRQGQQLDSDGTGQGLVHTLRLYGDARAVFDMTWQPGEIELVN
jgi:hypothetical protein